MSTSIFCQNSILRTIFKEKVDLLKNVFLALISALLVSSELIFAQIFLELLSIVSGQKHEVLLYVFLLVATNKILDKLMLRSAQLLTLAIFFTKSLKAVMGKHPDLMVGPPTSTVFPTNDQNFERLQFFEKIFEKI